jgi:hypothetical protein
VTIPPSTAHPGSPGTDRHLFNLAVLLGLAVAGGLSLAAWRSGLMLYADGALFSFTIGIDAAWALVWHIMPARFAIYLLTVLPAETAHELGLPAMAAMRLYQALFIGMPFLGLAACVPLVPRGSRWLLLFPVLSLLALTVSALGYPSETLLTQAAFWPALFGCRFASGRAAPTLLTLMCISAFLFSHPGMVFSLPLLPLAAAIRWRECRASAVRRALLVLGSATALLLGLWAVCLRAEMSNPGIIQSGQHMWSASRLREVVTFQPSILIVLLIIALWGALSWRRERALIGLAVLGLPAIAILFALMHGEIIRPESHYYIRTALVLLLPVLGATALWRVGAPPHGAVTLAMMAALAVTQLVHDLRFLGAWYNYRDSVATAVTRQSGIVPLQQVLAGRIRPDAPSIAWSWGQPLLSLTLPGLPHVTALVADPAPDSFSVLHCSEMDRVSAHMDWVPPATRALLKGYVCARRPE